MRWSSRPFPSSSTSMKMMLPRCSTRMTIDPSRCLPRARRASGLSMPWSTALRIRCTRGARIDSSKRRSSESSDPTTESRASLWDFRDRSRTVRCSGSSTVLKGRVEIAFSPSSSVLTTSSASSPSSLNPRKTDATIPRASAVCDFAASRSTATAASSSSRRRSSSLSLTSRKRSTSRMSARTSPVVTRQLPSNSTSGAALASSRDPRSRPWPRRAPPRRNLPGRGGPGRTGGRDWCRRSLACAAPGSATGSAAGAAAGGPAVKDGKGGNPASCPIA